MSMIVTIYTTGGDDGREPYEIADLVPPEDAYIRSTNMGIHPTNAIGIVLGELEDEWRQENPDARSDKEFVEWLVKEKGWGYTRHDMAAYVMRS